MKWYILLIGCIILSDCSQGSLGVEALEINFTKDVRDNLKSDFNTYNKGVLNSDDSCLFVKFLDHYQSDGHQLIRVYDSLVISNYRCPYTDFSFTLLRGFEEEGYSFYGNYDIFYMKYAPREIKSYDSGRIVPFENKVLPLIVNKVLKVKTRISEHEIRKHLKSLIYQLYFEDMDGLNGSVFEGVIRKSDLAAFIGKEENEIVNTPDPYLIIFPVRHCGIVIFKWSLIDDSISIHEFLIPFRKFLFTKLDVSPDYSRDCFPL